MSNLRSLNPAICVSLGNQLDVPFSDVLDVIAARDDIDCIGVYVEGFKDLDGLEFIRAVKRASQAGKTIVFYKAGRTAAGRSAAQGHTASLAGDWDSCCAAVRQAGALVATRIDEFERFVELGTLLHDKSITGDHIAAISNAGCETVAMADHCATLASLSPETQVRLREILDAHHTGSLINIRNPLDITPMSNDQAYEECVEALLQCDEVDAAVVGCVPMSAQLLTTAEEIASPDSFASRITNLTRRSIKPIVVVLDCAVPYEPLADRIRSASIPVFHHVDDAIASLQTYLAHRISLES
jgi:acyl-CoA synthetase (NDP forming)